MFKFAVVVAFLALVWECVLAKITIDTTSRKFTDEYKRTRIFHGVNAVYKVAPYHPVLEGFDSTNTLSDIDASLLKSLGFNVVRLGVMWPGVEPTRGSYNSTYLDNIGIIVDNLGKQNIQVILDFHQDLFHRKYCGEGFPDYVYELCKSEEPQSLAAFPHPVVNATYPSDSEGNPELDSCLSQMFAKYYLTNEVSFAFQCVYENKQNVWTDFGNYWKEVARRFKSVENVLGYELINEPWLGDVFAHPKNFLPKVVEKEYLQPLYQYLHREIRTVDDEKIIFYEGVTIDYWPNGFEENPGDSTYNDRQSLAYHIYCPMNDPTTGQVIACDAIDDFFLQMRLKDSERLQVGMIMTEFGAAQDQKNQLEVVQALVDLADRFQQSWVYWQYKYYQDITTVTPEGETLFGADGQLSANKMNILSRTYPTATAGELVRYQYDLRSKVFTMTLNALTHLEGPEVSRTSEIYVNIDLDYPHGVEIEVTSTPSTLAGKFLVTCPSKDATAENFNKVTLVQREVADETSGRSVQVNIAPCSILTAKHCTCK